MNSIVKIMLNSDSPLADPSAFCFDVKGGAGYTFFSNWADSGFSFDRIYINLCSADVYLIIGNFNEPYAILSDVVKGKKNLKYSSGKIGEITDV